jgi:hypothetical protein
MFIQLWRNFPPKWKYSQVPNPDKNPDDAELYSKMRIHYDAVRAARGWAD